MIPGVFGLWSACRVACKGLSGQVRDHQDRNRTKQLWGAAAFHHIEQPRRPVLERQRTLLAELAEALLARAPEGLEPALSADWAHAADDAARRRVVVDQVASLTDTSALAWHASRTNCAPPLPLPPPRW